MRVIRKQKYSGDIRCLLTFQILIIHSMYVIIVTTLFSYLFLSIQPK